MTYCCPYGSSGGRPISGCKQLAVSTYVLGGGLDCNCGTAYTSMELAVLNVLLSNVLDLFSADLTSFGEIRFETFESDSHQRPAGARAHKAHVPGLQVESQLVQRSSPWIFHSAAFCCLPVINRLQRRTRSHISHSLNHRTASESLVLAFRVPRQTGRLAKIQW